MRLSNLAFQLERFGLVIVWLAVIALFGALRPDTFLTWSNFSTIFGSEAVLVIVTLGLVVPLTAGDFDLSIAQVLTFVSMLTAILSAKLGVPLWAIIPLALAVGATVGLSDHLTYDSGTGALAYDADGVGGADAVTFATLGAGTHPATLGMDFLVV